MTCTIIGAVVINCLVANRPTPVEAAAVLDKDQFTFKGSSSLDRPAVRILDAPKQPAPRLRLDGSSVMDPPWSVSWQVPLQIEIVNKSRATTRAKKSGDAD